MKALLQGIGGVRALAAALLVCVLGVGSRAQQAGQTVETPRFDVVSIKPNTSRTNMVMMGVQAGGRFTATNVTLRNLITNAYRLQPFQLVGGPNWLASDRFDILAKTPEGAGDAFSFQQTGQEPSAGQLMLRAMLADRFKFQAHMETRELPIYSLVLARGDGKLGPKLTRSTTDCAALSAAARGRPGGPPPMPAPGQPMVCGMRIGPGNISAGGTPLAQVATSLANFVGRTIVDRTGLSGNFDFELTYTPDQMPARAPGTPADQPVVANGVAIDPNGPSIFTAIQEQLGLKLESTKGPVEVLVVDSVEHPTED